MKSRHQLLIATASFATALLAAPGCVDQTVYDLRRQVDRLQEDVADRDNQLVARRVTIEKLNKQLQECRAFSDEDLKKIFYPVKIEIASLSGGDDYDGRPGDDGITVYLKPIDRDGDTIKVAGDIRIELYDLQNPSGEKLIGEYFVPVDDVAQHWYGHFATYHYTVHCPWQHGLPSHDEITVRATFVDYLTQRVMTTQIVCTFKRPP